MKELFEQVIALKNYDLKALLANIDQYHIEGKLTDDERQELAQAAREGATGRLRLCRGDQCAVGGGSRTAAEHLAARRGRMA